MQWAGGGPFHFVKFALLSSIVKVTKEANLTAVQSFLCFMAFLKKIYSIISLHAKFYTMSALEKRKIAALT